MSEPRWDALALHDGDDVVVALRPLTAGETVQVRAGASTETIVVREAIAVGHKLARRDIPAGEPVRKYGAVIGDASAAIARGAHVHVHNLKSRRARVKP